MTQNGDSELGQSRLLTFVDLYAGCGGLSLGFIQAGWRGLFAVEQNAMAFGTLKHNLLGDQIEAGFDWPTWLPQEPLDVATLLGGHAADLEGMRGHVTAFVGGPPCQGFSDAGKRKKNDPRNTAYKEYIEAVQIARPALILLENVRGIKTRFDADTENSPPPHSQLIREELEGLGYVVKSDLVDASSFGVPQRRVRFFAVGIDGEQFEGAEDVDPFEILLELREDFLRSRGLPVDKLITVRDAISDLEVGQGPTVPCPDTVGFRQVKYRGPKTQYQRLLREGMEDDASPNSIRLVNHRPLTVERFETIQSQYRCGVHLSAQEREELGLKKHTVILLDGDAPSFTITTLPDDNIHYSEPRILTVRENARLQSFPDMFAFMGKYTTGGPARVKECPRYTQVGNAVPPLFARAWAECLSIVIQRLGNFGIVAQSGDGAISSSAHPQANII